jgi:hypothetical protein
MKWNEDFWGISTQQIGDGKLPNLYWVSYTNDYYICRRQRDGGMYCDWISGELGFNATSKTLQKIFKTFKEAMKKANELAERIDEDGDFGSQPKATEINYVTIEDRMSGQIYEIGVHYYPESRVDRVEVFSDLDTCFTKQRMKELGAVFE